MSIQIRRFAIALLFSICGATAHCAAADSYNPGDPASEEYYLHTLLRCALQDAEVCPGPPGPDIKIRPTVLGSSLKLWLEADILSQGNGTPVTSWTDQSSSGFNADQATGGQQPTFQTNGIGGRPAVRFDGSASPGNNLILGANYIFSVNDGLTMLAVARSNTEDNGNSYLVNFGTNATTGYGLSYSANSDGVNDNTRLYTGDNGVVGGGSAGAAFQATSTDSVIIVGRIKFAPAGDKHHSVYVNGSLVVTNTTYTITQLTANEVCEAATRGGTGPNTPSGASCNISGTGGPVTIGGQSKTFSQSGRFFDGDIALVLVFDKALTEEERQGIECYASLKYGIAVAQACN